MYLSPHSVWIDYTYSNTAMVIYFVGVGMFTVDIFLEFQVGFYEGGVLQKNRKDIFERKALFVLTVDVLTLLVLVLTFFVYSLVLSILKVIFFVKVEVWLFSWPGCGTSAESSKTCVSSTEDFDSSTRSSRLPSFSSCIAT